MTDTSHQETTMNQTQTAPGYGEALAADNQDATPKWTDDGHQVRVALHHAQFTFAVICPFDGADLTGKDWNELPVCRRALDEDGEPDTAHSPVSGCGLALLGTEFATDEFFDESAPEFEVVSPFPVTYRFGWDGDAVYVRPKPVDR